jgi:hypothetical protein
MLSRAQGDRLALVDECHGFGFDGAGDRGCERAPNRDPLIVSCIPLTL